MNPTVLPSQSQNTQFLPSVSGIFFPPFHRKTRTSEYAPISSTFCAVFMTDYYSFLLCSVKIEALKAVSTVKHGGHIVGSIST